MLAINIMNTAVAAGDLDLEAPSHQVILNKCWPRPFVENIAYFEAVLMFFSFPFINLLCLCVIIGISVVQTSVESNQLFAIPETDFSNNCFVCDRMRWQKKGQYKQEKEPTVIATSELVDFLEVPLEKLLELGIKSHKACLLKRNFMPILNRGNEPVVWVPRTETQC